MIRDSLATSISFFIEEIHSNDSNYLATIRKILMREFRDSMPKKYFIFPQQCEVYCLSKTLCIKFPSWGSERYMDKQRGFYDFLLENFIVDRELFDGNTTYLIRGIKYGSSERT